MDLFLKVLPEIAVVFLALCLPLIAYQTYKLQKKIETLEELGQKTTSCLTSVIELVNLEVEKTKTIGDFLEILENDIRKGRTPNP